MENKIKQLKKIIPFKWRVQSTYPKNAPKKAKMIAYVDARDVAEHLDNIIGASNWCDEYYELKGNIYCKIGILVSDKWVFKSDVGTPNKTEKDKSESSDAFKRAAVKWGINREAYRVGMVEIEVKDYNGKPYPIGNDKKFIKGQTLYDLCNKLVDIESLENYTIDEDTKESSRKNLFDE